jgi:hypothetical protein
MTASTDIDAALNLTVEAQADASKLADRLGQLAKALARLQTSLPAEKAEHERTKQETAITLAESQQLKAQLRTQAARLEAAIGSLS